MFLQKCFNKIYGRDTRPTQILNVTLCVVWAVMLLLHSHKLLTVAIPEPIQHRISDVVFFAMLSSAFTLLGFCTKGVQHQVFKFFGLSLGAVVQGILANGYFTAYPPLDMMLVVCLAVLAWLFGALIYILRCEGLNVYPTQQP